MMALLLSCFVLATPLAGSRIFVNAALQRGEFYAGVALDGHAAQPSVRVAAHARHLASAIGQTHVYALNLFLHLSGIFVPLISTDWLTRTGVSAPDTAIAALPDWELVYAIFEPPKFHPSMP